MAANTEHGGRRWSRAKLAVWAAPALFMLANVIAMQFTTEVDWSLSDFVFAGVVLYGALGAYELITRAAGTSAYRAGVGVALAAAVLLVWGNAAAGITDSGADAGYIGVLAIGFIGTILARFQPRGMAFAMVVTAFSTAMVGVIALVAGMVPAYNSAFEILGITAFYVALWIGAAVLFLESARRGPGPDAG